MSWPLKPLSELCLLAVDCVNKTAPVVDYPTPYKMIRTTNVKRGFIDVGTVRYVNEETFQSWTRRSQPRFGDVILTREAPVGEVGRCTFDDDQNIFLGQRLFQYRPDPELLDWNYLAYALQSPLMQNKLHGMSFGATVPHIKVGDAENLEIPCPRLDVQKKIGGLLAAYDDLIENHRRRVALLEESARLLYQEWVANKRFPRYESVVSLTGLPLGWAYIPLSELAEVNQATLRLKEAPSSIRYIDISSVGVGIIKDVGEVPFSQAPGRARRLVRHGDVIWSCVRPERKSYAMIWEPLENVVVSTGLAVISPAKVPFTFLYLAVTSDEFVAHLSNRATGVAYPAVTAKDFEEALILVPDQATLAELHLKCEPLFAMMNCLSLQIDNLTKARDALLPKLMSGAIQVLAT